MSDTVFGSIITIEDVNIYLPSLWVEPDVWDYMDWDKELGGEDGMWIKRWKSHPKDPEWIR